MTQKTFDIDLYIKNINSSPEELAKMNLPEEVVDRMQRIVDGYTHWTRFPRECDRDIVLYIQGRYGLNQNSAYEDLRLLKCIMGAVNQVTKDFARYQFDKMIERGMEIATANCDASSIAKLSVAYGKFHQLDKEDRAEQRKYSDPQVFYPVLDPRRAGFKSQPHTLKQINKLLKKYGTSNITIIKYEQEDYDLDGYLRQSYVQEAQYEEVAE